MEKIVFNNDGTTRSDRMIHTPSAFARKNLNFVQEIGLLRSLKAHSCIRENMDSYLIFLCLDGEGQVSTLGKTYDVKTNDIVFLDCHKHYEHRSSEEKPWKIFWLHFKGKDIENLFPLFLEANKTSPVFTVSKDICDFEELLNKVRETLKIKSLMSEIQISQLLNQLLVKLLEQVNAENEIVVENEIDMNDDEYSSLRKSVNEHYDEDGLLRILSIQYGLEEEKLSNLFKEKYGISLVEYIINRRFNKAKELLRFTIKPIEEIIIESGIGNMDSFKQLFIENEEMSPEDYRKKWAQWVKS